MTNRKNTFPHTFSIIIPVLHEVANINHLITSLRNQLSEHLYELIVVDGSPTSDTVKVITDPNVRCFSTRQGRAIQMNAGAQKAIGDILIFLHADTRLHPQSLDAITHAVSTYLCVAGAFDLRIDSPDPVFRLIESLISLRSRITRVPYGDQAIFIEKTYFDFLGGYKDIPIMEDVELMNRIKKNGDIICILPFPVATSPRRWNHEGIFRCTLRNWWIRLLYYLGVSPQYLMVWYPK